MLSSIISIAILATSVSALGNGNVVQMNAITSAAISFNGNYNVQNVATGEYMSFQRTDVVDVTMSSSPDSIWLEQVTSEGYTGTVFSGENKCASAQWGTSSDAAFTAYACRLGKFTTTDEWIVHAKQQWQVSEVECAGGSSDDDDSSTAAPVELAAKVAAIKSSPSFTTTTEAAPSATSDSAPAASATASSSGEVSPWSVTGGPCDGKGYTGDANVTGDKCTWICKHPGWWLARHYPYVFAGHDECYNTLMAYWWSGGQRRSKRSLRHRDLAKKLTKRGQSCYTISPTDHLVDQTARAVLPNTINTFGGYKSLSIAVLDKSAAEQQWYITSA